MKDALALIRERTSINLFDSSKQISEAEIRDIVADATQAPSSFNIQHWRFVAVTDPEKKKQLQAAAHNQAKVGLASATMIVLGDLRGYEKMSRVLAPFVKAGTMTQDAVNSTAQRAAAPY